MVTKAWSGRFAAAESPLMERFNASIAFDRRLWREDIQGSRAHARMLRRIGILTGAELKKLLKGLDRVAGELASGKFRCDPAHEDIHMAVEARLKKIAGPVAGKLHTARSRNDQVALDTRLFTREATRATVRRIRAFQKTLIASAERRFDIVMPGYTHLQRAQPVLLAHHLLAYFEMLERDADRFTANLTRLDRCPLGAGALAGTTIPIDRGMTAKELGFSEPTRNSLDAVSDRDFVMDYLCAAAELMVHLSRFAEELILWSSKEFGFVRLPEGFCTGSSMMPQKVNPDAPELIRGKAGRVFGDLVRVLTVMKGLPLAYNKDMQEDKEALFDAAETVADCLDVLARMWPDVRFDAERMRTAAAEGFVLATDLADYLAGKGVPFRKAHGIVGGIVREAEETGRGLEDFTLAELRRHSRVFGKDVLRVLSLDHAVARRLSTGGTAPSCVRRELARAKRLLADRGPLR